VEEKGVAGGNHNTALQLLKFMCYVNKVFLQDAAAMALDEKRKDNPIYNLIPVLRSEEFKVRVCWLLYCCFFFLSHMCAIPSFRLSKKR
jgi:hypothetical protein